MTSPSSTPKSQPSSPLPLTSSTFGSPKPNNLITTPITTLLVWTLNGARTKAETSKKPSCNYSYVSGTALSNLPNPLVLNVPKSLKDFLSNTSYTFVGVGIESDVEKLIGDYNLSVGKMLDLRVLASEVYGVKELKNSGIKDLGFRVLGREIKKPKSVTMSRWDNEWLVPTQVQYACVDAFLSYEIGRVLINGGQNSGGGLST
ncbi:Werner syndrome-like exonuclease [Tanacetum coccineum]